MDWLLDPLRWDLFIYGSRLRLHMGSMVWNSVLAAVPAILALVLLRPGARRTPAWWLGLAALLALLPNTVYVLTDVVHLVEDSRAIDSERALLTLYLPAYVAIIAWGLGCYVLCLRRMRTWYRSLELRVPWLVIATSLHLLVAIGVYLGRFSRLNSWDPILQPAETLDAITALATPATMWMVGALTIAIVASTLAWGAVLDATWAWGDRARLAVRQRVTASRPSASMQPG